VGQSHPSGSSLKGASGKLGHMASRADAVVEGSGPDQRTPADGRRKVSPAVAVDNGAPKETTNPHGAAKGVLAALVAQEKLTADEAQACLHLMDEGRVSLREVALLSVTKDRGAAQRVAQWLTRQVPLIP
jgi:hypothetical protein